ncbi:response regulator transcription factor [Actinoplanes sp. TBRC 11911]|uniref:helix-turn-helix transcriptional regulator n=1 Tax=Actinoplanes sp. TBRC 11911 TaxID=2729386 RepID=UPI00145FBD10|nr:response regulator transcription factor [Actinoplanes sp. TBRC 11911]NMO53366.1 response regulator transcription factor [Actinoplanes sp. TBRC 11911]
MTESRSSILEQSEVTDKVDVALLVDTEVLLRGLESLLAQIPNVRVVARFVDVPLAWPPHDANTRLVITTVRSWPLLGHHHGMTGPDRPRVLLVGDDLSSDDISGHGELPCDGVLLLADATVTTLGDVLRQVVAGAMPMPAPLTRQLLTTGPARARHTNGRPVALTPRESEMLSLLARGLSNKQIAKTLGISTHGVKRLVGTVLLKLGAPNRTTAVITAMTEGLV